MSDYVSNEIQGDLMGPTDPDDWEAWTAQALAGWDSVQDDASQTEAVEHMKSTLASKLPASRFDAPICEQSLEIPASALELFDTHLGVTNRTETSLPWFEYDYTQPIPRPTGSSIASEIVRGPVPDDYNTQGTHGFHCRRASDAGCEMSETTFATSPQPKLTPGQEFYAAAGQLSPTAQEASEDPAAKILPTSKKLRKKHLALDCPYADCTYTGKIYGKWELDRHILVKHEGVKSFLCPFPGCLKGPSRTAFARSDKLTSHIRNEHPVRKGQTANCPVKGCSSPPLELDLLGVHLWNSHLWKKYSFEPKVRSEYQGIANAASTKFCPCPIWQCRKQLRLDSLPGHLIGHERGELMSIEHELLSANYQLVRDVCYNHSIADTEHDLGECCSCQVAKIQILCPVCKLPFPDHSAFQTHVNDAHFVAEATRSHFLSWREVCQKRKTEYSGTQALRSWEDWWIRENTVCPNCDHTESNWYRHKRQNHHLTMLVDPEGLKPFRREILRLYPAFATHPVWQDLA